jgi:outer membrane immunogenic protein
MNRVQERSAVKKLILAGVSLIASVIAPAIGGSALAADMAVEPIYQSYGVPVPVAYNWTGFYIGVNAGGHFARDDISTTSLPIFGNAPAATAFDAVFPTKLSPTGGTAGMQMGYNWQIGRMLLGLEVDGNWVGGSASRTLTPLPPPFNPIDFVTNTSKSQFLTTVRPRWGVALDRWIIYVTGGLAFETFITSDIFSFATGFAEFDKRNTRTGETVGGGVEYAILDSWTLKLEYLYLNFGSYDVTGPTATITVHHQIVDNVARIGLNYRFPVYWKY